MEYFKTISITLMLIICCLPMAIILISLLLDILKTRVDEKLREQTYDD